MIAALIITLIVGSLVGLFLNSVTQEIHQSYRARMAFQAVNIAEAGLEFAMYSLINDNWQYWEKGSAGYYRDSFPWVYYSYNRERPMVRVFVDPSYSNPSKPDVEAVAVSEGTITLSNGMKVSRQILIELTVGNKGFWGNGILAKEGLDFGGTKQTVDSFSSSAFSGSTITDIYDAQVRKTFLGHDLANGRGSVASLSINVDDISVGNADIFGSLATGADQAGVDIDGIVGPQGSVYNHNTQPGDETFDGRIDSAYIGYEFYASLPNPEAPELASPLELSGFTVDKKTPYTTPSGVEEIYIDGNLNVKSGAFTIRDNENVVMVINGTLDVDGEIVIGNGATLELYVSGDMDVGGNGIVNSGKPADLMIFNTGKDTLVKLHGNGFLSAAVYAPNSDIELMGGGGSGEMFGAVVGKTVTFAGNNYDFHYDEDLANIGDDDSRPEIRRWVELTDASQRKNMATILNDGL
ncbi:MAG: DUF7305 domain-containing protein [Oceanipulchritudo sp.]